MRWAWSLRPLVIFAAAYTIIGCAHEAAHAFAARLLGVRFVLTHLYVNVDLSAATLNERAVIGVSGPLFCLAVGLICLFVYRRADDKTTLWLLYLGWFGVATLLGNLMSTAFVGDFSALSELLRLPMWLRYLMSISGAVSLCGFAFLVGRELRKWAPKEVGRIIATIGLIVIPVIFGTMFTFLIFLPMPANFAAGRLAEPSFWVFAAVGTFFSHGSGRASEVLRVSWVDFAILLAAIVIVRIMAHGIALVP